MEVRKGIKQTDLGIVPSEWDVNSIEHLNLDISDGNYSSKYPKASDFKEVGVPFIRANNIKDMKVVDDQMRFISVAQHNELLKGHLKKNDILITTRGELGNIALVPDRHIDSNINAQIVRINTRGNIDHKYLAYFLTHESVQKQIKGAETGSALKQLPVGRLIKIPVIIPPLPEQQAIAAALSDVDSLLTALDALIAKKRLIKQGAMQELLYPKKNWVEKRLGNTAILKARIGWQGLTTAEYLESGDYFLVTGTDFKNGYIDWDNCHFVDEWRYKQDKYIQLQENDVLVTKDGTIGKVALIQKIEKPATLNSGVFVIRPIEQAFHPVFFYYLLTSKLFTDFLAQLSAGSTINHLYQKDFVTFIYRTPPTLEEQTAIAEVLSDMDAEISALETRREKTRLLKQGMMQELLTGRIRLV